MNKNTMDKIEILIEEANAAVGNTVSEYRPISDTLTMAPIIGGIGNMAQGYQVGKRLGHPVAGTLLGAEAAAGAKSNYDDSVGIGDVYTKGNMLKRGGQGAVLGGGLAGINIAMQNQLQSSGVKDALHDMENRGGFEGYSAGEALQAGEDPLQYAGEEMLATGAGAALLGPGLKYGLGKLFGSKTPSIPSK